jgi:hypothetical protein
MNINFHDPAISISVGVILIGFAFLIWAIGKLRQKPSTEPIDDLGLSDLPAPPPKDPLFETEISPPVDIVSPPEPEIPRERFSRSEPPTAPEPTAPPVNKEMVERLDAMSQRLTEMQTVLQRQVSSPAGASLTADTLDKLLKIIGNVTLQVDILQRSLGATPSASPKPLETISTAAAAANPPPSTNPAPASSPTPTSGPATSPGPTGPGGRPIGVTGGALSSFNRPGNKPGPGSATPPPASNPPG